MERNSNGKGKSDSTALSFNGQSSYVTLQELQGIDGTSITVSAWIKPFSFSNNYPGLIQGPGVSLHGTGPAYNDRRLDGRVAFYVVPHQRPRSREDPEVFTSPLECNQWCHIAAVYNSNGATKIFLDGHLQSVDYWSTPIRFGSAFTNITVGAIFPQVTSGHHFHGLISHVTVWRIALPDELIPVLRELNFAMLPTYSLAAYMPGINGQTQSNVGHTTPVTCHDTQWILCDDLPVSSPQLPPSTTSNEHLTEYTNEATVEHANVVTLPPSLVIPVSAITFTSEYINRHALKHGYQRNSQGHVLLGRGGYAEVKLVEHARKLRAHKSLLYWEEKRLAALKNEFQLLTSIRHENVLSIIGGNLDTDSPFLVLEYAQHGSLCDLLKKKEVKWSVNGKHIALQIAQGIFEIHSRRIIHKDIKPGNILLADGYIAKVADMGISRPVDLTRTSTNPAGTYFYSSPEQLNNLKLSLKTDVYSFGVVLWEILTNESTGVGLQRHLLNNPRVTFFPASCPAELVQLILRCLQIDPDQRPDIEECVEILQRFQD